MPVTGPVAILTFTHARNDISDLIAGKKPPAMSAVVRARIVMPTEALGALRDVINQIIGASRSLPNIVWLATFYTGNVITESSMKRLAAALPVVLILVSPAASEDSIVGTWKIQSFVREVVGTGQRYNEFGERPDGYISYLPDGRMHAMLVADNRVKPTGALPTDEEKAKLFGTMIAYACTYRIDGEKVIHDVQVSWNQLWTGSQQVRFFKAESDTLTITTAVAKSPRDGLEGRTIVVFKKVH